MGNVKLNVLARFLDEDASDWTENGNTFECGSREYMVLTEEEADEAAAEYIKETLWAFNASFIASHTAKGLSDRTIKALQKMQGELCEDANDLVEALIDDMDDFIQDAIETDGRGHFLSQYDGEENEETDDEWGKTYYIYRCN